MAARVVGEAGVVLDQADGVELAPELGQPPLQILDGERGPRGRVELGADGRPVVRGEVAHAHAAAARAPLQQVQELGVVHTSTCSRDRILRSDRRDTGGLVVVALTTASSPPPAAADSWPSPSSKRIIGCWSIISSWLTVVTGCVCTLRISCSCLPCRRNG
jgi:hypothetical protein